MLKKTIGMGGFTLAEVLITLGIIGVVAAMTMPTLINSTQGAQYKTAFKKSLTVLSQAVVMNIALNDYDLSQIVNTNATNASTAADTGVTTEPVGSQTLYDLFRNRLNVVNVMGGNGFTAAAGSEAESNFYKIVSDTDSGDRTLYKQAHSGDGGTNNFPAITDGAWPAAATFIFMNDGITFIFDNTQSMCMEADTGIGQEDDNYCFGFIDVNGQKAPNRVVQCDGVDGSDATEDNIDTLSCTVSNPTDIYPIAMYNQSVVPATPAARAVLYNK